MCTCLYNTFGLEIACIICAPFSYLATITNYYRRHGYACPRCETPHRLQLKFHLVMVARYVTIHFPHEITYISHEPSYLEYTISSWVLSWTFVMRILTMSSPPEVMLCMKCVKLLTSPRDCSLIVTFD